MGEYLMDDWKKKMKIAFIFIFSVLLIGCSKKGSDVADANELYGLTQTDHDRLRETIKNGSSEVRVRKIREYSIDKDSEPKQVVEDANDTQAKVWRGCPLDENARESLYERWSKRLDEQFWPYSLEEYEYAQQDSGFDVVYGLGGRWITARYLLREGHHITREEMVQRITQSLEFYGWKQEDLPDRKYVLSKIYETAKDDLYFTRGKFSSEGVVHYSITIHISDDAGVLVLYCEAGW